MFSDQSGSSDSDETNTKDGLFSTRSKAPSAIPRFPEGDDTANHVAADAAQLFPGSLAVGKLNGLVRRPGVSTAPDAEIEQRHGVNRSEITTQWLEAFVTAMARCLIVGRRY
jgi:hypothetical protein